MKVKEWFKNLLAGMGIGVGAAIPGVSGAAIAVIFKVYEKIIWAVNNFRKNFKTAFAILLPVLLGCIIAVIPCVWLFDKALESYFFGLICVFAGFLIGSFTGVTEEVKGVEIKPRHMVLLAIGVAFVIGMGIASALTGESINIQGTFESMPWWFYIIIVLVGIVAAVALTVPGLSGSLILLILGFYKPLVSNTVDWTKQALIGHDWSNFPKLLGMLGCFAVGVLIGVILVSKLMKVLLAKWHDETYFAIIGFVGASIAVLFFNWNAIQYYQSWSGMAVEGVNPVLPMWVEMLIGGISAIFCAIGAFLLTKLSQKSQKNKDA